MFRPKTLKNSQKVPHPSDLHSAVQLCSLCWITCNSCTFMLMPIFLRYGWHVIADDLHQLDLHVPPQCIQNIQSVLPTPLPNRLFDCQFVLSDHILLILPSVELSVRLILSLICLILPQPCSRSRFYLPLTCLVFASINLIVQHSCHELSPSRFQ